MNNQDKQNQGNKQFDPANKQQPADPSKKQFGGQENAGPDQQRAAQQGQRPGQDFGQQKSGQGDKMHQQQADELRKDSSQQQGGQGKSEQR